MIRGCGVRDRSAILDTGEVIHKAHSGQSQRALMDPVDNPRTNYKTRRHEEERRGGRDVRFPSIKFEWELR
jgi:hypothetical protein